MTIARVTLQWTGFSGAPGYTNFYFNSFGEGDQVDLEVDRVFAFADGIRPTLPSVARLEVSPEVAFLDEATGDLLSYATATTPPEAVVGAVAGAYSAPTGASITWNTPAIAKGRRLRGRTFVVPLGGTMYDLNGTLSSQAVNFLTNAATALIGDGTGPQAVIWSRPVNGAGGSIGTIDAFRVPDRAAVLRSRRD